MPSLATIQAALVAKVIADLSPTVEIKGPASRQALLAPGLTAVLALGVVASVDQRQSNQSYPVAQVTLEILHRLAAPGTAAAEAAYLEGAAQIDQLALADFDFWRAVAGVHEVLEYELVLKERVGNVLAYSATALFNYTL